LDKVRRRNRGDRSQNKNKKKEDENITWSDKNSWISNTDDIGRSCPSNFFLK
jgi:hypothetical protein